MRRYTVYRHRGKFISKRQFDRLKSRGLNGTVQRNYVYRNETIEDVSELFDYDSEDQSDFVDVEFHGTGDTGKGKGK